MILEPYKPLTTVYMDAMSFIVLICQFTIYLSLPKYRNKVI